MFGRFHKRRILFGLNGFIVFMPRLNQSEGILLLLLLARVGKLFVRLKKSLN